MKVIKYQLIKTGVLGMVKKKTLFMILFALILFLTLYFVYIHSLSLNKVGFQSDKVYFGMSPMRLKIFKGKPIKYESLKGLTGGERYNYLEFAYNYPCYVTYYFNKLIFQKLTKIYVSFIRLDSEEIEELFYNVRNYMIEIYSKKENFYDKGIENYDNLTSNFGTRSGATGISVSIRASNNELYVTIDSHF